MQIFQALQILSLFSKIRGGEKKEREIKTKEPVLHIHLPLQGQELNNFLTARVREEGVNNTLASPKAAVSDFKNQRR